MYFDTNNIICTGPELTGKTYTITAGGYTFSSLDKEVLIYHKKELKCVQLKNLGDGMAIFYTKELKLQPHEILVTAPLFLAGLTLFSGFDEQNGQVASFLYKFSKILIPQKNRDLTVLQIPLQLIDTTKGTFIQPFSGKTAYEFFQQTPLFTDIGACLHFLCGLSLLYGKLEGKLPVLASCTWKIPLFGQYTVYQSLFEHLHATVSAHGFFIETSIVTTPQGMIYQISTRDYEILRLLQKLYKPLANYEQISTHDVVVGLKPDLLAFLEAKSVDVVLLETIKKGVVKLLIK